MNSLYLRLKGKINAIQENEHNKTVEISNVRFEGAVRKDLENLCGFFDYDPLTSFLAENFHRGYPVLEDTALFHLRWVSPSKKVLGIHYLLVDAPPSKLEIWVLEVFDPIQNTGAKPNLEGIKSEVKGLSKKGVLTGVQELVKFAVRVLTGG